MAILVTGGHSVWVGFAALVMGSLSVYGLLSLLFFAGVAGLLLGTLAPVPRVTLALVIGVAAALACGAMLDRLMGDTSGEITEESTRIEGREVRITREVRPAGTGEAIFALNGGVYQNIPVRSLDGDAIRTGQMVVVVEVRRGIALVEPLGYGADDGRELEADEAEEPSSSPSPGSP